MLATLRRHWPEYLIEAAGLGLFMLSANAFGAALEHPDSALRGALPDALPRRVLMGAAMGLTAIAIIYSPWGKRSGAHLNPSVTLAFLRLGKVRGWDALFYSIAQVIGGVTGAVAAAALLGRWVADPAVGFVATLPGPAGAGAAFAAEFAISFGLMLTVLVTSNAKRLARYTGLFAGLLIACYITFEAPLSGMSMNPARSVASAVPSNAWNSMWLYLAAPPLGMLLAAEAFARLGRGRAIWCAKLQHDGAYPCIFICCRDRAA